MESKSSRMTAWSRALAILIGLSTYAVSSAQVQVTTYHNDIGRTGLNPSETILTQATVNPKTFGHLFSLPVDGQVYAEPLYLPQVAVPGKGTHNVVYVATEHNSVYAFDADNNSAANSQPLWHVNFGPTIPSVDTWTSTISPEVGITGSPVIVPQQVPIMYVVSATKTFDAKGNPIYAQTLHALDVRSGAEMLGGPVKVQGSVPGTGDGSVKGLVAFNPLSQLNRAALLFVPLKAYLGPSSPSSRPPAGPIAPGTIYVAIGSHSDSLPNYHGWVFAFDATNLSLLKIFCTGPNSKTDPSGYPVAGAGIWQGGCGPASDGSSIYFSTGNGLFNPSIGGYGDSILRLADRTMTVLDYFAPHNQQQLDDYDTDLGSGGVMLLPKEVNSLGGPSLLVHSGKEGTIVLANQSNLGKNGPTDQVVGEMPHVLSMLFGAPAYFNGYVYYGSTGTRLVGFPIKNGKFSPVGPSTETFNVFYGMGTVPSISSNGNTNGIVWAVQTQKGVVKLPAILHAYAAGNLSVELYNSGATNGRDSIDVPVKFATPMIANGKVYLGLNSSVAVFGLGSWPNSPRLSVPSGRYQNSVTVSLSDLTPGSVVTYTLDGSLPSRTSSRYAGPITLTSSASFRTRLFTESSAGGPVVEAEYMIDPVIGTGTGLRGTYVASGPVGHSNLVEKRIDPSIDFEWLTQSPFSNQKVEHWKAEWTGRLQAESSGRYTFSTNGSEGVTLWVNGKLLLDTSPFTDQATTSGTIALRAGAKYSIKMEYVHNGNTMPLQLFWSGTGLAKEILPTSQLYSDRVAEK